MRYCLKINLFIFTVGILVMSFSMPIFPDASDSFERLSAKVDSELANYLAGRNYNEFIRIELTVAGGLSAEELIQEMEQAGETLDEKRRYGLNRLRDIAASTQVQALEYLNSLEKRGLVRNIQSHWLTNTISIEVAPQSIESAITHKDIIHAFRYPDPIMIEPDDPVEAYSKRLDFPGGVEENLKYIGADQAWRMGYTGKGRWPIIYDGSWFHRAIPSTSRGTSRSPWYHR